MPLRHLVVTPLPNGRRQNTLLVSVHLSPRLRTAGFLEDYPDFADWGQFVTAGPPLQFQALINGAVRPGVSVAVVSPAVQPPVWRAVFGDPPRSVPVEPFTFQDRSEIDLRAIDSSALSEQILALVRALAELGADPATRADVLTAAAATLRARLTEAQELYGPIGDGADPAAPSKEFHDQLGPLGAHPHLMRLLGLVFDLEVTMPPGAGAVTDIAVRTNWPTKAGLGPHDQVPMRVQVDAEFRAVVDQPEYRQVDWLSLGGPKYAIGQLDVINATLQMAHLLGEVSASDRPAALVEVPALAESGMSVICGDLGDVLRERLVRQRQVEDGIDEWLQATPGASPPMLFAEDITLGYRCDVDDADAPGFRSLHDRQVPAGYHFPRDLALKVTPPRDEGWSSIALSTDGGVVRRPQATTVQYSQEGEPLTTKVEALDETAWRVDDHLATWGGWSLAAPRIGRSTNGSGEVKERERNVAAPGSPTQLIVDYAHVNATLPALRYGRTYTLRGRCVDLAGNGPRLTDTAPPSGESPPVRFGRLAPLVAPLPVRRASRPDPGVGDLPDVVVIRSELEQADTDTPPADRLLFPPRISQGRLERHGLPAGGNDPASYAFLAERDARSLADQAIVDPETGELVAGSALVDGHVIAGPMAPEITYLVDPVAAGAAFLGLPGTSPEESLVVGYGEWPDTTAVLLELRAGQSAPTIVDGERRVTVCLPKGTIASAEVSTALHTERIGHLALAQHLDAGATVDALEGRNRLLSPRRSITLVHAVRLPLEPPRFVAMAGRRTRPGQTDFVLAGTLGIHRATTDHVVLEGRWIDPIDDPVSGPTERVTRKIVADLPVAPGGPTDHEALEATRLELADTRRRQVTLTGDAFCRFSRYFTERIDVVADPSAPLVLHPDGVTPASVVLTGLDDGVRFRRDVDFAVDRASGVLTVVAGGSIAAGTRCRVELVPMPVSRSSLDGPGPEASVTIDVPSSAAPLVPAVVAALPAFDRRVTESPTRISVVHDGRVVRLHLGRPWFTSGTGELLAVAIAPDAARTRLGRDPLVAGAGPITDLTAASFSRASEVAAGVDGRFDVAAHEVTFDAERALWMADVLIDAREYRPLVELHVCRYQPLALDGHHVSATVEVEPLRLGAPRRVVVERSTDGGIDVSLRGPDDDNEVRVIVQEADPAVADPDLRWHDVSTSVLTRSGTRAAADHSGSVGLPSTGAERRVIVEDAERVTIEASGALEDATVVAYREVIAIPADW